MFPLTESENENQSLKLSPMFGKGKGLTEEISDRLGLGEGVFDGFRVNVWSIGCHQIIRLSSHSYSGPPVDQWKTKSVSHPSSMVKATVPLTLQLSYMGTLAAAAFRRISMWSDPWEAEETDTPKARREKIERTAEESIFAGW